MTEGFLKPNAKTAFFQAIFKFRIANQLYIHQLMTLCNKKGFYDQKVLITRVFIAQCHLKKASSRFTIFLLCKSRELLHNQRCMPILHLLVILQHMPILKSKGSCRYYSLIIDIRESHWWFRYLNALQ